MIYAGPLKPTARARSASPPVQVLSDGDLWKMDWFVQGRGHAEVTDALGI